MAISPQQKSHAIKGNNKTQGFPRAIAMDATPSFATASVRVAA